MTEPSRDEHGSTANQGGYVSREPRTLDARRPPLRLVQQVPAFVELLPVLTELSAEEFRRVLDLVDEPPEPTPDLKRILSES